jgi:hypothetical protein
MLMGPRKWLAEPQVEGPWALALHIEEEQTANWEHILDIIQTRNNKF